MSWTDERVAELKRLWGEGFSASQIAHRLGGGISRSSVIGKVHRLKLFRADQKRLVERQGLVNKRIRKTQGKLWGQSSPAAAKKRAAEPLPEPYIEKPTADTATRTLVTLERGECRWPIGDPKVEGFGFCGCKAIPGKPYCEAHSKRAFVPVALAMRRKPIQPDQSVSVAAESVRSREGVS
jgi:GcrA cell cycle regulator